MLSNNEFQDLLAYIDTLDRESVVVMRETLTTFLTGAEEKQKELLEEHTADRAYREKLHRVVESNDADQLSTIRKKLGITK